MRAALRIGACMALACLALTCLALTWLALTMTARAQTMVADLSEHEIKINTSFAGADLLLFGVTQGTGNVIVTISGPENAVVVRKKSRVSGIWINTESVPFEHVPGFYHVAATPGLSAADLDDLLRENGVGFRYLNLAPAENIGPAQAWIFRKALIRRKEIKRLYTEAAGQITTVGDVLFRTKVRFPANVPVGRYRVDVFHVADGWVTSTATIPLIVRKAGLEASIYDMAYEYPALYGVFAIAIAAVAGYGAGMLFGRR